MLVLLYFVVRLFMPVWWATRISDQTQGSLTSGIVLGLVYGFVFTFVPLLIAWQARYKKVSWLWKAVIVLAAVLVAIPNLLTLSIYANSSAAAAKARNMIDISATWFPSWSIGGAITGLVLFISIAAFWHLWHSRGQKMKPMKSEMKARNPGPGNHRPPRRPTSANDAGTGDTPRRPPKTGDEFDGGSPTV